MPESTTILILMLRALARVPLQPQVFARDPYESRRTALKGEMLLKVLVIYEMLKANTQRGLVETIDEHPELQQALGGRVARNTLSNALQQREPAQMIEAWLLVLHYYGPQIAQTGKKFARIAAVDASLIKLSLAAFTWAAYREQSGAAKMHCVLNWVKGVPEQFVFSDGKMADVRGAQQMVWAAHWTYLFDRGYFSFELLNAVLAAKAHFVIRFKKGVDYQILERFEVPEGPQPGGLRLLSDWTVRLPGWGDAPLRLVSYRLPDGKLIRVLTDRFDLTALSIAQLYKARWSIEHWWKWIKKLYKVKAPLGRSENSLQVQIVGAFVTDLLLRAFKQTSGFSKRLYHFVVRCQEESLASIQQLSPTNGLRQALEAIWQWLTELESQPQLVT